MDYFVSRETGEDTNDGLTYEKAFATIPAALEAAAGRICQIVHIQAICHWCENSYAWDEHEYCPRCGRSKIQRPARTVGLREKRRHDVMS